MKHSAKIICRHPTTGMVMNYNYRSVIINVDYTKENKFIFNNVRENGEVFETTARTLAIAKGRIDRAIKENRIKEILL